MSATRTPAMTIPGQPPGRSALSETFPGDSCATVLVLRLPPKRLRVEVLRIDGNVIRRPGMKGRTKGSGKRRVPRAVVIRLIKDQHRSGQWLGDCGRRQSQHRDKQTTSRPRTRRGLPCAVARPAANEIWTTRADTKTFARRNQPQEKLWRSSTRPFATRSTQCTLHKRYSRFQNNVGIVALSGYAWNLQQRR